jgi:hypothetical protein
LIQPRIYLLGTNPTSSTSEICLTLKGWTRLDFQMKESEE